MKIYAEGGIAVQKFIARLIDCGMPRDVAVCVCRHFGNDLDKLACYVSEVEQETNGGLEAV